MLIIESTPGIPGYLYEHENSFNYSLDSIELFVLVVKLLYSSLYLIYFILHHARHHSTQQLSASGSTSTSIFPINYTNETTGHYVLKPSNSSQTSEAEESSKAPVRTTHAEESEQCRLSNIGCGQDDLAGISAWVGTTLERDIEAAMLNTELTLD